MNMKLRSETNMTPEFLFAEKLGFTTSAIKDRQIGDNMTAISALVATGHFKVIPATASVTEVTEAVGFPFDWNASDADLTKQQEEMAAIVTSGKLAYHYEVVCHRYFEETDGVKRAGTVSARRGRYASAASVGPGSRIT